MGFMVMGNYWLRAVRAVRALCLLGISPWVWAWTPVVVSGVSGDKALISVNGAPPKVMRSGETRGGVKLLGVEGQVVVIEEAGRRRTLGIGLGAGVSTGVSTAGGTANGLTVLSADGKGQFFAQGNINGVPVRFLVDTGASVVTLPASVARRAGIVLANAEPARVSTANGPARARRVLLNTVRVGEIRANLVDALVLEDGQLGVALLGMSFLNHANLKREGDQLTLSQRY
jgi:aspartyl protease family protein